MYIKEVFMAKTISVRLKDETVRKIDIISKVLKRSRSSIIKELIESYLEDLYDVEEAKRILSDKDDEIISHEQAKKRYFQIKWKKSAVKSLKRLTKKVREKIVDKIEELSHNPFYGEKLKGTELDLRRLRIGEYRVIYLVEKEKLYILIIKIGLRGDVYKNI